MKWVSSSSCRFLSLYKPCNLKSQIPRSALRKGSLIEQQKELGLWALRLPSADSTVVRRTQASFTENPQGLAGVKESIEHVKRRESFWSSVKPAHFSLKIGSKSLLGLLPVITLGVFLSRSRVGDGFCSSSRPCSALDFSGRRGLPKRRWRVLPSRCGLWDNWTRLLGQQCRVKSGHTSGNEGDGAGDWVSNNPNHAAPMRA